MAEAIEMVDPRDHREEEYFEPREDIAETSIDFPDVPVTGVQTSQQLQTDLNNQNFVQSVRKELRLTKTLNPKIYNRLTTDDEGYFYYNHKRLNTKSGKKLLSVSTLLRNPDTREFLHLAGYTKDLPSNEMERERQTVAPEQTTSIKSKTESFKLTENWAKEKKEEATRKLEESSEESEKQRLRNEIQDFEQMEIQARRRYNEVMQNQLRRINSIINDETRPLAERLRELFRRDGLTIGALIIAIGMTISAIVLAVLPSPSPPPSTPNQPAKKTYVDDVKNALVKIANWFLDLAKKALISLPGVFGGILSFILKKAAEVVLFFSEHLVLLLLASVVFIVEIIWKKKIKTK